MSHSRYIFVIMALPIHGWVVPLDVAKAPLVLAPLVLLVARVPTMHLASMNSALTQAWYLLNSAVQSFPRAARSMLTPPGWNFMYGVKL